MSYSAEVKKELSRRELNKECCQAAELAAFIRLGGNILISGKNMSLNIVTTHAAVARRIFMLYKNIFKFSSEVLVRKKIRLRKSNVYLVRIPDAARTAKVLTQLGMMAHGNLVSLPDEKMMSQKCCRRSYLRGAFLVAGSVNNPESSYHLELYTDYSEQSAYLEKLMISFKLSPGVISRKNRFVVYLKESSQISEFFNIIGAHSALLNFENTRILKSIRNSINRLVNFETANVDKTVRAAIKQQETIKFIEERAGLETLSLSLQHLAKLRMDNPEGSLQELGELLVPPLGKSGVSHRMRKLEKIAEQLRKERKV